MAIAPAWQFVMITPSVVEHRTMKATVSRSPYPSGTGNEGSIGLPTVAFCIQRPTSVRQGASANGPQVGPHPRNRDTVWVIKSSVWQDRVAFSSVTDVRKSRPDRTLDDSRCNSVTIRGAGFTDTPGDFEKKHVGPGNRGESPSFLTSGG